MALAVIHLCYGTDIITTFSLVTLAVKKATWTRQGEFLKKSQFRMENTSVVAIVRLLHRPGSGLLGPLHDEAHSLALLLGSWFQDGLWYLDGPWIRDGLWFQDGPGTWMVPGSRWPPGSRM